MQGFFFRTVVQVNTASSDIYMMLFFHAHKMPGSNEQLKPPHVNSIRPSTGGNPEAEAGPGDVSDTVVCEFQLV